MSSQPKPKNDEELRREWDEEAEQTIDESALRGVPDWMESLGPEDESRKIVEENLDAYGWEIRGEDDYVSNPTTESDMPTWLDDDYDDNFQDALDEEHDELADEDDFYSS